jgi:hypothetical protein
LLLLGAGAAGAAVHWRLTPENEPTANALDAAPEPAVDPAEAAEKELLKKLRDSKNRSDLETTNSLIELAMLYVQRKKPEKALQLLEVENLRKLPAIVDARNLSKNPTQYLSMVSGLGKGIIRAYLDEPALSLDEFKKVFAPPLVVKIKVTPPIDAFLWRYDQWKRLVADALERDAKNLGVEKLEEPLNRYRQYSSKTP